MRKVIDGLRDNAIIRNSTTSKHKTMDSAAPLGKFWSFLRSLDVLSKGALFHSRT